jgi:Uma2 family endonuclease
MEAVVIDLIETETTVSDYETERGKPMPSFNHSKIQARISQQLLNNYEDEFDILSELTLSSTVPDTVPDVCILPVRPSNWFDDETKVSRIPLTVVEIISPSQTLTEMTNKAVTYFVAGVQSYWLVQPSLRTVFILRPGQDELVFHNQPLTDPTTGITIDLKKVFR